MFADGVLEGTTTEGTGNYLLDGAPDGYETFLLGFGDEGIAGYVCRGVEGGPQENVSEFGWGEVVDGSPVELTRNLLSSTTGSLIAWAAGDKVIYNVPLGVVLAAMQNGIRGSARPGWLPAGGTWIKDDVTPWELYRYTGTVDVPLGLFNATTGSWSPIAYSSSDSAAESPMSELFRDSPGPAAADLGGARTWTMRSSTLVKRVVAKIVAELITATNAAEDAALQVHAIIAGTLTNVAEFWRGLVVGDPLGGDRGVGTINVDGAYYEDNWILTGPAGTLTDGANIAWDLKGPRVRTVTLGGNRTLDNPTNLRAGTYVLVVKQDGTGGRTLAYGNNYFFEGGVDPTLSTAINAIDVLCLVCDGTNMFGSIGKSFAA